METRHLIRTPVILKAKLISGGKSYAGIIRNLSENGAYVETAPTKTVTDFIPETTLKLEFKIPSGERLNLNCEVIWLYTKKTLPPGFKQNNIGMEIIDPPLKYKEFLKTL